VKGAYFDIPFFGNRILFFKLPGDYQRSLGLQDVAGGSRFTDAAKLV
jgi:hypothetical protein